MWVSVNDKLPDQYDYVLISYIDDKDSTLRFTPSVGYFHDGIWITKECLITKYKDLEKDLLVKVTHWMQLPNSPQ